MNTVMPNAVIPSVGAAALIQELRDSLDEMTTAYCQLSMKAWCGNGWPDRDPEVIKARKALEWARTFDWEAT